MPSRSSPADPELPAIDDRLVTSETRYEMLDGELVYVSPADKPHGTRHLQVGALVEAHVHPAFDVAIDMLTRTSKVDDVAPDVSVFPDAPDPVTAGRQLEQLAFEIVSTQKLGNAGIKAAKLVGRGVRRVFAIDIERSRMFEWSHALGGWSILDSTDRIVDPALEVPMPIEDLIHAARTDDAVARALIAKGNPVFAQVRAQDREAGKDEGLAEGRAEGLVVGRAEGLVAGRAEGLAEGARLATANAVLRMLAMRNIAVDDRARAQILGEPAMARLEQWIERSATCTALSELFEDP